MRKAVPVAAHVGLGAASVIALVVRVVVQKPDIAQARPARKNAKRKRTSGSTVLINKLNNKTPASTLPTLTARTIVPSKSKSHGN